MNIGSAIHKAKLYAGNLLTGSPNKPALETIAPVNQRILLARFLVTDLRQRGWTTKSIANPVGVSSTTIRRWLAGTQIPTPKHLAALISVYTEAAKPNRRK